MSQDISIMERLRTETRDAHTRVEALPFFTALAAGELPLASYVGLLRALRMVYEALEQAMLQPAHPLLDTVWDDSLHKLPLLHRDLVYFQPRDLPESSAAMLEAHLLAQQVRRRAHDDPVSLLGYLYVLEGSTLGGVVLRAQVARTFGLSGSQGLAYLSSYAKATKAHWRVFSQRMNRVLTDEAEQDRIVAAAQEAFIGMAQIIAALYPFDEHPPRDPVRILNPEAGSHPIPSDARELQAALRAGEHSWREFPYYAWRYGERGERFTRSDSAWLVTLAEHDAAVVEQQILWLGRLLSARGMPQWMLELHLNVLHSELVAAVPEKQTAYARLRHAAHTLGELRRRHISDEVLMACMDAFDRQVGSEWRRRLPRTGGLLAAAVADERAGISQAVTSIEGWMTEPSRFPEHWIVAVRKTIRTAREHAI